MPFESFVNDDFCRPLGECSVKNIIGLLSDNFGFSQRLRDILAERYDKMRRNFLDAPYNDRNRWQQEGGDPIVDNPRKRDALLEVNISDEGGFLQGLRNYHNLGLDLPVWFAKNGNPKKKIMIIAQDPLRNGHEPGNLILSTPWGVHSRDYKTSSATQVKNILEYLLTKYYAVCITDSTKFYFTGNENSDINERKRILQDIAETKENLQEQVLKAEIGLFKPNVIITLGKDVIKNNPEWGINDKMWSDMVRNMRDTVRDCNYLERPLIPLLHPNAHDKASVRFLKDNDVNWYVYFKRKIETFESQNTIND